MTPLSVLVVDDEPLARRRLIRLLNKLDWVGEIREAGDIIQAKARVDERMPDILLLDIQMPGGAGFELLDRLGGAAPAIVFVTAFDHHALRAFDANAIDYVTKPIEPGRFALAMTRARSAAHAQGQADRIVELQETLSSLKRDLDANSDPVRDFWVKSGGHYVRIPPETILYFQADRDYVRIHVPASDYLYQESLASLERRLSPGDFWRVHRSAIVRRGAIARIKPAPFSSLVLVLTDGAEIRVGKTYSAAVRAALMR
ncbi:DNA-binding LytR/AlgR family response regulator [Caulobacter sp. BE264]|uniref:LytR/AlgR family response regulator transcription factor n=1 Tax=Caulobacter sp. BE264 TaxID=2817724 RepID=UPI002860FCC9|nr:LytTR family DNA-binding domain-containing protein [Caulobacter sp. BE264]MDR7231782.1 DNA-binding LytR/AlgR family response regulator [Caulobacter sp. BE264]